MKQAKRLLALVLVLATVLSTLSVTAWATGDEEIKEPDVTVGDETFDTPDDNDKTTAGDNDPDDNDKTTAGDNDPDVSDDNDKTTAGDNAPDVPDDNDKTTAGDNDPDAPEDNDETTDITDETHDENLASPSEGGVSEADGEGKPAAPAKAPARVASNAEVVDKGTTGDVAWAFYNDGTLVISGNGRIPDLVSKQRPWYPYRDQVTSAIIEEGVTHIGENAFVAFTKLASIELPSTLTSIGNDAFRRCLILNDVVIPEGVTSIGQNAFNYTQNLTNLDIPSSVTSVGKDAFSDSAWLKTQGDLVIINSILIWYQGAGGTVIVPNTVTSMMAGAFSGATGDVRLTLPDTLTSIPASAFEWCQNLTEISIPDSVTTIGAGAFYWCSNLTSVNIPAGVTSIPSQAFSNCQALTAIVIPNGVTTIGESAFNACGSLTEITIPDSVTNIGKDAFYYCTSLKEITLPQNITTIAESTFDGCQNLDNITIPDGVKTIEFAAFRECENLTKIVIPASVTTIGKDVFDNVNEGLTIYGYIGSVAETEAEKGGFTFVPLVDISTCTVSLSATRYTYDGSAKKPTVTVKDADGEPLTQNTDYTVAYTNNIKAGTATVTVTGTDGYTGQVSKTFTIDKANQSVTASISASSILYGATATITAKGVGALSYTSDHTNVATVDASGVVKGKGGGTATITVTAAGDANHKPATATVKVTVNCATPAISKLENTLNGVRITWNKVDGADKYRIWRKTGSGSWVKLADTTSTSYTDKTVVAGTKYTYTVQCVSSDGKTTTSDYNKTGKSITTPLSTPQITAIENIAKGVSGIKMNWGKVSGATSYEVYRRKHDSGGWQKIATVTSPTHTDTSVRWMTGTLYDYSVVAVSSSARSAVAPTKTILRMAAPAITDLTNSASKAIKATWSQNKSADGYQIWYQVGENASTRKIITVYGSGTLSRTISDLTKGNSYKVFVRSFKKVNSVYYYSAWSASRTVKVSK